LVKNTPIVALKENFTNFASWKNEKLELSNFTETISGFFVFFYQGSLVVLANGFQKKTQQTPKGEINKALKIKREYESENE
jgi:phage-related protein